LGGVCRESFCLDEMHCAPVKQRTVRWAAIIEADEACEWSRQRKKADPHQGGTGKGVSVGRHLSWCRQQGITLHGGAEELQQGLGTTADRRGQAGNDNKEAATDSGADLAAAQRGSMRGVAMLAANPWAQRGSERERSTGGVRLRAAHLG
jgi:hypothetical protein